MEGVPGMLSVEKAKSDTNSIISRFDLAISEAETATPRQSKSPAGGNASAGESSASNTKTREGESLSTASLLNLFDEAINSSLKGVHAPPSPHHSPASLSATVSSPFLGAAWVKALDSPGGGTRKAKVVETLQVDGSTAAPHRRHESHNGSTYDMEASLDPYLSRQTNGYKAPSLAAAATTAAAAAFHAPAADRDMLERQGNSASTSTPRCLEAPPDSPSKRPDETPENALLPSRAAAKDDDVVPSLSELADGTRVSTEQGVMEVQDMAIPLFHSDSPGASTSSSIDLKSPAEEGADESVLAAEQDGKSNTRPSDNATVVASLQPSTVEVGISIHPAGGGGADLVEHEEIKERWKGQDGHHLGLFHESAKSNSSPQSAEIGDVEITGVSRPSPIQVHRESISQGNQTPTRSHGSSVLAIGSAARLRKMSASSDTGGSFVGSLPGDGVGARIGSLNSTRIKAAPTMVLNLLRGRSRLGTEVTTTSGSWTFVNALVEGIQFCVERERDSGRETNAVLGDECFSTVTKDHLQSREGSMFKFKDYCQPVFRKLRHTFGVDDKSYLASVCENGVSEISTAETGSKSGQKFLISSDGRYFMKTCTRDEARFFLKHLKEYYNHIRSYKDTLLCRFFGVHRVKVEGRKLHLLVLGNVFDTDRVVNHRYDLKGSRVGRKADLADREKPTAILKDLDYDELRGKESMLVGPMRKEILMKQIRADCEFLCQIGCMDYSMLVGIHKRNNPAGFGRGKSIPVSIPKGKPTGSVGLVKTGSLSTVRREDSHISQFQEHDGGWSSVTEKNGIKVTGDEIYLMGIIDFLQFYNKKKRAETFFKGFKHKRSEISAVHPKLYASRFAEYMESIMA